MLIQQFFHALRPIEFQGMIHPKFLRNFYHLFINLIKEKEGCNNIFEDDNNVVYVVVELKIVGIKDKIIQNIKFLEIQSPYLISLDLYVQEKNFLGYILFARSEQEKANFLRVFEEHLS